MLISTLDYARCMESIYISKIEAKNSCLPRLQQSPQHNLCHWPLERPCRWGINNGFTFYNACKVKYLINIMFLSKIWHSATKIMIQINSDPNKFTKMQSQINFYFQIKSSANQESIKYRISTVIKPVQTGCY